MFSAIPAALRHSRTSRIISLIASLPAASFAQTAPPDDALSTQGIEQVTRLEALTVSTARLPGLTRPSISTSRADLASVPGGVEVVEAARFLRGRSSTLADTFALSAGVFAQSRFGSDEARISIRGSGLQRTFHGRGIRILQDGVPLNLADGSFDMQALEPLASSHINIWRGANALAHGASTLGGAIEYVSRDGLTSAGTAIRTEAGSHGYLRMNGSEGRASGVTNSYVSFTHQAQDGYRRHAGQSNQRVFANIGMNPGPGLESHVFFTAISTESELPGSLTRAQMNADPRQAAAGNVSLDQRRDFELLRLASRTVIPRGPSVWDFTASWTYKDLDHPIFQVIDQVTNDILLAINVTHAGTFAGLSHRLRAGGSYNRGSINAANFVNASGRRGALVSQARQRATNFEAFAEEQLEVGRGLTLVAGASAAFNRRDNGRRFAGAPDYVLDYRRIMPKAGFRWDRGTTQTYGNISSSYEPPSFSEALTLNTARDAQTAVTIELGTRGTHGPLRWDASVYRAGLRRELLTIDNDNNPATPAATINANRTRHSGVELALDADLLGGGWDDGTPRNRLALRTAWTHGRFRFDDDPAYGGNTIAGLPEHLVRGELMWESASGFYAGPTVEWVPSRTWIDHRNTFAAEAYMLAGIRIGHRGGSRISWFVELRNALDRIHAVTTGVIENAAGADQPQFLPGDGRSVFVGIELNR